MPIEKPFDQDGESAPNFVSPLNMKKPISIETALIYGEVDRFYNVLDPQ